MEQFIIGLIILANKGQQHISMKGLIDTIMTGKNMIEIWSYFPEGPIYKLYDGYNILEVTREMLRKMYISMLTE